MRFASTTMTETRITMNSRANLSIFRTILAANESIYSIFPIYISRIPYTSNMVQYMLAENAKAKGILSIKISNRIVWYIPNSIYI